MLTYILFVIKVFLMYIGISWVIGYVKGKMNIYYLIPIDDILAIIIAIGLLI